MVVTDKAMADTFQICTTLQLSRTARDHQFLQLMPTTSLSSSRYTVLWGLLAVAYVIGLFVPLMDSDAAHHANIALHMYQHDNFVDLVDKGRDYLDKPHLLFWLSALSYYVFGVTTVAYKIPSLLFSLAGIWATYRLGTRLYNRDTGRLAALILGSAQAFILACMDVRMDAILTSCMILAVWQLVETVHSRKWYHPVLAALFMALGFSTKGLVGIVMPGVAIFFYLLYQRAFRQIFHPRWILVGLMTAVFMLPVVYCYYLQFDRHPEKVIRGMTNISGIKFILWGQNIERLDGKSWGGGKRDYLFYLHTMLWAFLPWSILAYYAAGARLKELVQTGFRYIKGQEGLTTATCILIFILISLSKFQLPHYLNILFPFFAILVAARLLNLAERNRDKTLKVLWGIQAGIAVLLVLLLAVVNGWFFPLHNWLIAVLAALALLACVSFLRGSALVKLISVSVGIAALVNILLSGNFYPAIMNYQGGTQLAKVAKEQQIPLDEVRFYQAHSFTFDFYTKHLTAIDSTLPASVDKERWYFTSTPGLESIRASGLKVGEVIERDHFRVTRLSLKFLKPETRPQTFEKYYLVKIEP